jgi:hypothetical protein
MNEKALTTEQRLDAVEAKVHAISLGLNTILTDITRIDNAEATQKEGPQDPSKYDTIFWETATGSRGEYQKTSEKATQNHPIYQELLQRLKKNKGKARIGDYFYWQFDKNPTTIGRKKVA